MKRTLTMTAAIVALGTLVACGGGDETSGGNGSARTIEIEMVDIAFEPETIEVERGEQVRFVFTNSGKLPHDAFIGDSGAQADHENEMREADDGHGDDHGGDGNALTVDPGETGELTHTFEEGGTVEIGCHQPGHYEAGMRIVVEVA